MTKKSNGVHKAKGIIPLLILLVFLGGLNGCGTLTADNSPTLSRLEAAAGTATALIEDAKATLMVKQAQALATSMISNSKGLVALPPELVLTPLVVQSDIRVNITPTPKPTVTGVQILDISTAADGNYLIIEFTAPVRVAETWQQGNVYLVDEIRGTVYSEIPVTGSIGPLFARPKEDGKMGYFMLVNAPFPLKAGALVTVVMGDFIVEHLTIQ